MPQELLVLRCYSCAIFQVHIAKKAPKWDCKLCGKKQCFKKIYARGSGKNCRLYVQQLNQEHLENAETLLLNQDYNVSDNSESYVDTKPMSKHWEEFLVKDDTSDSERENAEHLELSKYSFQRPTKKRKLNLTPNKNTLSNKFDELLPGDFSDIENKSVVCSAVSCWEDEKFIKEDCFADSPNEALFKSNSESPPHADNSTVLLNPTIKENIKPLPTSSKWDAFCDIEDVEATQSVCNNVQSNFDNSLVETDTDSIFRF